MCTLTFIPQSDGFILTSSRDEVLYRSTVPPKFYSINGKKLYFPKDEVAGGTWLATDGKNKTVCLLNGGLKNHIKQPTYLKSRGQLVLETFQFASHTEFLEKVKLNGIEPFTLILIDTQDKNTIWELVWDGNTKHIQLMSNNQPKIWSSSTLYNELQKFERKVWFRNFLEMNMEHTPQKLIDFHCGTHTSDTEYNIKMMRSNELQTVSLAQLSFNKDIKNYFYVDFVTKKESFINLKNEL